MAQIDIIPTLEIPPIKIDMERLYNIALDSAHKAAEKEIYEFYMSYGSPFRKMIKEALEKTIPNGNFEIPNLLEKTQDALVAEFEKNANKSIVECCANQLKECLTKLPVEQDGSIKLSKVFKIMSKDYEYNDDIITMEAKKDCCYTWYDVTVKITSDGTTKELYRFTLHANDYSKEHQDKYVVLSIKNEESYADAKMEIDGLKVSVPVFKNLAHSSVMMTIAKLVMFKIPVEIDDTYFTNEGDKEDDY